MNHCSGEEVSPLDPAVQLRSFLWPAGSCGLSDKDKESSSASALQGAGTCRPRVSWASRDQQSCSPLGCEVPRSSARWTRAIRGGVGTDESQGWDESLAGQGADSWHAVGD